MNERYYPVNQDLRFPTLSTEQERDLFRRAKSGDDAAREQVVGRHLLYVMNMGQRFSGNKLPMDETTSAANEALMVALGRFDPERGFAFRSFLVPYVRAAIARCWRARAPVDFKHGEPPVESPLDYQEADGSLNTKVPAELTEQSHIEQDDHDTFLKGELATVAETLTDRERQVLKLFYADGYNNAEIGKMLKLSRERIRQIHQSILGVMKARLERRGVRGSF